MNSMGEWGNIFGLPFKRAIVHRSRQGKIRQEWLSACTEERALTSNLLEEVLLPDNMLRAYRKVVGNGGSAGVDGMQVKELKQWLKGNLKQHKSDLLTGRYVPQQVRGVKIPKPKGGHRQLGIPTVIDRFIQQSLMQVLSRRYEQVFSENSYGFRLGKSSHGALDQAGSFIRNGKEYVIDLDLEKFFDKVNHDRLMWLLSTRIGEVRVLSLIRQYLKTGILEGGLTEQRVEGTPQGSPLSPLLSNIVLDELDKELERRGLSYERYADDVKIFVSSKRSALRVKTGIEKYIEGNLKLKENNQKSRICKGYQLNFLGHSILKDGSLGLSEESERRVKEKIKELTQRKRGVRVEQVFKELRKTLEGWLRYFRKARMKEKLSKLESWMKRRIRSFRLKQCKRRIGIVRFLTKLGISKIRAWRTALSGKGRWRLSNSPALKEGMNNKWFLENGYYSLVLHYERYKPC